MSSNIFDLVRETQIYKLAMKVLPDDEKIKVESAALMMAMKFDSVVAQLEEVSKDPVKTADFRREMSRVNTLGPLTGRTPAPTEDKTEEI